MHTEREITQTSTGFAWICGDCGRSSEQEYRLWDDVIFSYRIHQFDARVADLETTVARLNAAWVAAGIDNYLDMLDAQAAPEGTATRG